MLSHILAVAVLAIIWYGRTLLKRLRDPKPVPDIDVNQYWGSGERGAADADDINTFSVNCDQAVAELSDILKNKVQSCKPLDGVGFEYGVNATGFEDFSRYWTEDYLPRWSERQSFLNSLPQYTTEVQGLNIHFIHTQSEDINRKVVPILMLHGWPGSVREFYEIIALITKPDAILSNVVFNVIAPSLPGYGWSEATHKPGLSETQVAVIMRNLMLKLGYDQFYIQGGDWGSLVGSAIATLFPQNVIGYHSNFMLQLSGLAHVKGAIASCLPSVFVYKQHQDFFFPMKQKIANLILETGYLHVQSSKPDTIGIALSNNPVGLAAYIFEKFSTWTNPEHRSKPDGGWSSFSAEFKDAILDNTMIYYLSNSITTSLRLYAESFSSAQKPFKLDQVPTHVPAACARFKHDPIHSMDWQLRDKYPNLIQSSYYRNGGHFAALEVPHILFDDMAKFIQSVNRINKLNRL